MLKRERYYGKRFTSKANLVKMIEDYIVYYNTRRLQRKLRLSIKVYFQYRRVCIREALPLEGVRWVFWSRAKENSDEGVFSPHFAAKSIIRSAHTPHPSATPPPSPHVGKAKRNLENFLFAYTF